MRSDLSANQAKVGFEESLDSDVISTGLCVGCAACVIVCPFSCLEYADSPRLVKECEDCGICPQVCPKYNISLSTMEQFVFGRLRCEDEEFGIYRRAVLAKAIDDDILSRCQDGGAVTAILTYALGNNIVAGVALSSLDENTPLYPKPMLATTAAQVLESAGTRYTYSQNLLAFREGVNLRMQSLAFVGTPCQIHAIRRIQGIPLKKYSKRLSFTIGLMCTESFTYKGLFKEHLEAKMAVDLNEIEKINIKGKILVSLRSGEVKTIPLSEAKKYVNESCHSCGDFSAELADISAGGLGLDGWTFLIIRTEKGEEIFNAAVNANILQTRNVEEEPFAHKLLLKLSERKRQRL